MLRIAAALIALAPASAALAASPDDVRRGEYLVERVGMCSDCHSPRDERGAFIRAEWLRGATLGVTPKHPLPGWADYAPALAGLPANYTEASLAHFLETGFKPDGKPAGPPMPPFRFSAPDAQAIVGYLRTVGQR